MAAMRVMSDALSIILISGSHSWQAYAQAHLDGPYIRPFMEASNEDCFSFLVYVYIKCGDTYDLHEETYCIYTWTSKVHSM